MTCITCIILPFVIIIFFKNLLFGGFPCVFGELCGDAQANAHQDGQYDIGEVSA